MDPPGMNAVSWQLTEAPVASHAVAGEPRAASVRAASARAGHARYGGCRVRGLHRCGLQFASEDFHVARGVDRETYSLAVDPLHRDHHVAADYDLLADDSCEH